MSGGDDSRGDSDSFDWPDMDWPEPDPLDGAKPEYRDPDVQDEHREFYWSVKNRRTYRCPDCGASEREVGRFEVHHIDGDPENGFMENLIGLCHDCHVRRHRRHRIQQRLNKMRLEIAYLNGEG